MVKLKQHPLYIPAQKQIKGWKAGERGGQELGPLRQFTTL